MRSKVKKVKVADPATGPLKIAKTFSVDERKTAYSVIHFLFFACFVFMLEFAVAQAMREFFKRNGENTNLELLVKAKHDGKQHLLGSFLLNPGCSFSTLS